MRCGRPPQRPTGRQAASSASSDRQLLRRRRRAPPQVALPVEVRRARALPQGGRARTTRRTEGAPRHHPQRASGDLPRTARRDRAPEADRHARGTAALRHRRVRDIQLKELERMSGEIASWQGQLSERSRLGSSPHFGRHSAPQSTRTQRSPKIAGTSVKMIERSYGSPPRRRDRGHRRPTGRPRPRAGQGHGRSHGGVWAMTGPQVVSMDTIPRWRKAPTCGTFREVELGGLEPPTSCMPCLAGENDAGRRSTRKRCKRRETEVVAGARFPHRADGVGGTFGPLSGHGVASPPCPCARA
jgi:hypothetical protein